jgi:hypothetical protein
MYERAIEVLEKELSAMDEAYRRERANLEKIVAGLREAEGKLFAKKGQPVVPPGSWKGMGIADAIQAYITRCDGSAKFPALVDALIIGGVDLGTDPERYQRNIRSTLGNCRNRFRYNRKKEMVELVSAPVELKASAAKQ